MRQHQFTLRRLLALMLAWGVGLAGLRLLHFGPWTIGCALMYGALATLLILLSSQRILKFWCLSLVYVTFAAAIFALACLDGAVPRVLQEILTPAKHLAEEQGLAYSGDATMFASLLIWPRTTDEALWPLPYAAALGVLIWGFYSIGSEVDIRGVLRPIGAAIVIVGSNALGAWCYLTIFLAWFRLIRDANRVSPRPDSSR